MAASNQQMAEGYWLTAGLVWSSAAQKMQVEASTLEKSIVENKREILDWALTHVGSGKVPPPVNIVIPHVQPKAIITVNMGIQAFAIEILLKAGLARQGMAETVWQLRHDIVAAWDKLDASVQDECQADFNARVEACKQTGRYDAEQHEVIRDLLIAHRDDFMDFRYGQSDGPKGKIMRTATIRDRLNLLILLITLESVIAFQAPAMTAADTQRVHDMQQRAANWFPNL